MKSLRSRGGEIPSLRPSHISFDVTFKVVGIGIILISVHLAMMFYIVIYNPRKWQRQAEASQFRFIFHQIHHW